MNAWILAFVIQGCLWLGTFLGFTSCFILMMLPPFIKVRRIRKLIGEQGGDCTNN